MLFNLLIHVLMKMYVRDAPGIWTVIKTWYFSQETCQQRALNLYITASICKHDVEGNMSEKVISCSMNLNYLRSKWEGIGEA